MRRGKPVRPPRPPKDPNEIMKNGKRRWENREATRDPGKGWLRSRIR